LTWGEGKELGFEMEEGAAAAAVDAPLKARGADGLELREAREWRTDEIGEDATYREAVTWWLGELRRAAKMVRDVKADDAAEVRERIGNVLRGWRKSGGAADYIRSHLASAKARKASTIIKDITRTNAAFGAAEAAWKKLDEHSQPADFKPLAEALKELARANYQAYYDQPVEHDAWEAGDAVFEAFHKALKAAAAPAK
jgi:hypothetical protein